MRATTTATISSPHSSGSTSISTPGRSAPDPTLARDGHARSTPLPCDRAQLGWYLAGVAAWFVPQGMMSVLLPWVIGVQLALGADRLGIAQSMFTLPALLFILFGGVLADRSDERRILIVLHAVAALPALVIGFLAWQGRLSYSAVLTYVFITGTLSAFIRPARDSMLARVAGAQIQSTVTAATGLQFGVQVLGFGMASAVELVGPGPLFKLMGAILIGGAFVAARLHPNTAAQVVTAGTGLQAIGGGLKAVAGSPRLYPVIMLNLAIGVFYMGTFFVVVPMMILREYAGGAGELALANIAFMLGTFFSTMVLLRVGGVQRHRGRVLAIAMLVDGGLIGLVAHAPPFPIAMGLLFLWGAGAGVTMSMGRTIVQENAAQEYRARVLSVYALGFLGGAPLGALMMGFIVEYAGVRSAGLLAPACVTLCVILVLLRTRLWWEDASSM